MSYPTILWLLLLGLGVRAAGFAEELRASPIDLSAIVNMGFRDEVDGDGVGGWTDQGGNDFRHMPTGEVRLCGVPFRIIDPAKNNGKACLVLKGEPRPKLPESARVAVGQKGAAVAFLHSMAWGGDDPVATYVVRYRDNSEVAVPIRPQTEILNWWGLNETETVKIAVQSSNLQWGEVCLHAWVWKNPKPDQQIESIEFRSTNSKGVPVLVAATVLSHPVELKSERREEKADMTGVVWLEAESPTTANIPNELSGWKMDLFSGELLMAFSLPTELDAVEESRKSIFKDGVFRLNYRFDVTRPGDYVVWGRAGPAEVYAPFRWRVDEGPWGEITHANPFLDMYEVSYFQTLGWIRLGEVKLAPGQHDLIIEVPRPVAKSDTVESQMEKAEDEEGKPAPRQEDTRQGGRRRTEDRGQRWLLEFDCFVLSSVPFHPNGVLKPGERIRRIRWLDEPARNSFLDFTSQPISEDGRRERFDLDGLWEMARDQEPVVVPRINDDSLRAPLATAPAPDTLAWMGVRVPHTEDRPEMGLLHRRWYRKFVSLPRNLRGKRVSIHFSEANWVASVFVNGKLCGTHVAGYVPFSVDISDALLPGERNEILVGIKGLRYFMTDFNPWMPPDKMIGRRGYLAPGDPGWDKDNRDGLSGSVWLETRGTVFSRDPFAHSQVEKKQLRASAEIENRSPAPFQGTVRFSVSEPKAAESIAVIGETAVSLAPSQRQTVEAQGSAERLTPWWPGQPRLYTLRTEVRGPDGRTLDVSEETFGFRDVRIEKHYFRINGKRYNFRDVITGDQETLEECIQQHRDFHCNQLRVPHSGYTRFFTKDAQRAVLRFMDEQGIPVRFNSQINGMIITLAIDDPRFWTYTTAYFREMVRAYRNHPSIIVWTAENELDLINNMANRPEPKRSLWKMMQVAHEIDPSRPVMADGAGDLLGECEICNWHYPEVGPIADPNNPVEMAEKQKDPGNAAYPDNAFTFARVGRSSAIRPWDRQRPLWVGETYFYSGKVKWQGWIGGDEALSGRFAADEASARFLRILGRGYRWQEVAGFNLFTAASRIPGTGIRNTLAPLAVFPREYSANFYRDATTVRHVKIFNDTLDAAPVRFEWELLADGKAVDSGNSVHEIPEGFCEEKTIEIRIPADTREREEGALVLRLLRDGRKEFEESHPVSLHARMTAGPKFEGTAIHLFDPQQAVGPHLARWAVPWTPIDRIEDAATRKGIVVIGPRALNASNRAVLRRLTPFVEAGGRILVLEQDEPLPPDLFPTPFETQRGESAFAYPRGDAHPALRGIGPRDLTCWANGHTMYRWTFVRDTAWPVIVDSGSQEGLSLAPVIELPWGKGLYLLSQLLVGPNLGQDPIADRFLTNCLQYLASRRPTPARLSVLFAKRSGLDILLGQGKVPFQKIDPTMDLDLAFDDAYDEVNVLCVPGDARSLQALNKTRKGLQAFADRGGWVLIDGIEDNAISDLSRLVGEELIFRPVGQERIVVLERNDPLLSGIGNHDFYREVRMNQEDAAKVNFLHGDLPLQDAVFTSAIVYDDVCGLTHWRSLSNGLTSEDHWKYILYYGDGPVVLDWKQSFEIHKVVVRENRHYKRMEEMTLILGDDEKHPLKMPAPKVKQPIVFEFEPRPLRSVTLSASKFIVIKPGPMGWDTVEIYRKLSDSFRRKVVPLTRPAGLVKFPMGKGGVLLTTMPLGDPLANRVVLQLLHNLGVNRGGAGKGRPNQPGESGPSPDAGQDDGLDL